MLSTRVPHAAVPELTDRDPRIEAAAFPLTDMKMAFAAQHSADAPMFAYNTGLWLTMNNADWTNEQSKGRFAQEQCTKQRAWAALLAPSAHLR